MDSAERFSDTSCDPPVRGYLHRPEVPSGDGVVLSHGAGGNAQSALLQALAEAFAGSGFIVLRCDLPFRQLRHYGPPRPGDAARDRQGLKSAVALMTKLAQARVFVGGQSYGGRQASMLLAEEKLAESAAIVLSAPSAGASGKAKDRAFAQTSGSHFVRPRNTRSLWINRGDRVRAQADPGEELLAAG